MSDIGRRGLLKAIGVVPLAALAPTQAAVAQAAQSARAARAGQVKGQAFAAKFFDAHEYATVRALADMVIPRDERSGGATDAGVPEFMDFVMRDPLETERERESRQIAMRGGLAWLDHECTDRFARTFIECGDTERRAVLDDIAWPEKARDEMKAGARFFTFFRDLTASGFWSSKIGTDDLRYQGNTYVAEWNGCPPEALARLGVESE